MKVKCVNSDGAKNISFGKTYNAKQAKHSDYWSIKNDAGEVKSYHKFRFEIIKN